MGITSSFVLLPFLGLLLPVFITQNFDSPMWLGICLSAFGGAATLGALLFKQLEHLFSRTTVYYSRFLLTALSIMTFSFVDTISGIIGLAIWAGLLLGADNPLEQTVLQEVVPKNIAGQVFTSSGAFRFVTGPIGLLLAGVLVESAGVQAVFVGAGALLLVAALILGCPSISYSSMSYTSAKGHCSCVGS
ncbi:MAG: hypothetical protein GFH27_549289n208 [Chloroflexi bacterium AL-W]|nr:hypothetical protein [Chloroflexi bacterium AL-N1]NOK66941.1 hypothetical protein [Chloroflexi bacterium AL-N10]NOK74767.1 hypothetical protein [Chloroflexi bacterium AL-N5]NOK81543.1 hypothetical protein [Chloroflexi bacterium AL-W]NOK89013.1 hypothetical protein [Chloroflexi bacterium AL-N15]